MRKLEQLWWFIILGQFILAAHAWGNVTTSATRRGARVNLVSFDRIGRDVNMGLDFQMPLMRVPMTKYNDTHGNQAALLSVNTGAVFTTSLLAVGGIIVGHLFKSLGVQYPAPTPVPVPKPVAGATAANSGSSQKPQKPQQRFDTEAEHNYPLLLDIFKLIYTNASGDKIETTLPRLFAKMEDTFLEHSIDLNSCMEKSVCTLVYKSSENMRLGRATGLQKIIDGISNFGWLRQFVRSSFLGEAIEAGRLTSSMYSHCDVKYPTCEWAAPEEKLLDLINTHVKFT